jgi:hypothetical protein
MTHELVQRENDVMCMSYAYNQLTHELVQREKDVMRMAYAYNQLSVRLLHDLLHCGESGLVEQ